MLMPVMKIGVMFVSMLHLTMFMQMGMQEACIKIFSMNMVVMSVIMTMHVNVDNPLVKMHMAMSSKIHENNP
jgi:hypothetical protein